MKDFVETGPGTVAGRYLRGFWQPVYHSVDLATGTAKKLRVLGQDFVLYRGDGGDPHLVDPHCPHRGTLLSTGWIEDDCIRCFYHGWKFDADGACVEQPAEESEFAHKVRLRTYTVRDYLGLIFAYLGEGETPDLPLYPEFESFQGLLEVDSYSRNCNYFQNLENALDMSHVGFVHGDNRAVFNGIGRGRDLTAGENAWGITYTFTRGDGRRRIQQFGMPNVFYMSALPTDPDIGWQESLFWWTPVEDDRHVQFSLHKVPVDDAGGGRIKARRLARRSTIDLAHQDICDDVLAGRLALRDVDPARVDLVRVQDDIAQLAQGRIAPRTDERLGRADIGVIEIRKLWRRELDALAAGKKMTQWRRPDGLRPSVWGLNDTDDGIGNDRADGAAEIVDIRPFVEIEHQLRLLHGAEAPL